MPKPRRQSVKELIQNSRRDNFAVTVYGRKSIVMEGCKKIVYYTSEDIILEGEIFIHVSGENLSLKQVGNNNVIVDGRLKLLDFPDKVVLPGTGEKAV